MTITATQPGGATVNYSATANDLVDGAVTPSCSPASGTVFALGSTTVNCSATDAHTNSVNKSFSVTVVVGPLHHIAVTPKTALITAGGSQSYASEAFDQVGNSLGVVTGSTTFTASSGASCTANSCGSTAPGTYTITGTYSTKTDTATLSVTSGVLDHISILPTISTIAAGDSQTYAAAGYDSFNNPLGDVTTTTTFSIGPDGSCSGAVCTASVAGTHIVTANNSGKTATATLTISTVGGVGSVTVIVAIDADGDGTLSFDEIFAPALAGATITATSPSKPTQTKVTDTNGSAQFELDRGVPWTLCQTAPSGWAQSVPATGCLTVTPPVTDAILFGDKDATPPAIAPSVTGTQGNNGWYTSNITVSFTVSDAQSSFTTINCDPTVISTDGTTTVTCTATSVGGTSSISVTVKRDATKPVLSPPANITKEATGPSGAVAAYSTSASDATSGVSSTVSCSPASGSTFGIGTTTVNCSVTDMAGNTKTGSFTVTVQDTTPPTISNVPANITKSATSGAGATATYTSPTANDLVDGTVPVTCVPASGALFPIGVTTVTCTATDSHSNTATATFTVTVTITTGELDPPFKNNADDANWGQKVPIKFALTGDSSGITDLAVHAVFINGNTVVQGGTDFTFDRQQRKYDLEFDTSNLPQAAGTTVVWTIHVVTSNNVTIIVGTLTLSK
jgi:hypothetical protein